MNWFLVEFKSNILQINIWLVFLYAHVKHPNIKKNWKNISWNFSRNFCMTTLNDKRGEYYSEVIIVKYEVNLKT